MNQPNNTRKEFSIRDVRLLYTMLRVHDPERSIAFYTGPLGMLRRRREDYPEGPPLNLRFSGLQLVGV